MNTALNSGTEISNPVRLFAVFGHLLVVFTYVTIGPATPLGNDVDPRGYGLCDAKRRMTRVERQGLNVHI